VGPGVRFSEVLGVAVRAAQEFVSGFEQ
jgi:hypothetical protein